MSVFTNFTQIGKYTVQNLIKSNYYTETYRAVDEDDNPYFLKLFIINRIPDKLLNKATGMVKEIEYSKLMQHGNIISFVDSGCIDVEEGTCQYYMTNYFQGLILSDYVYQNGYLAEDEALKIFRGILSGLSFMHNLSPALCHNDLDPSNIMLLTTLDHEPVIIDLGHVSERRFGSVSFDTADLDILYHANENMVGIYDEQSDIFSACAILYYMLCGSAPWQMEFPEGLGFKEQFMQLSEYRKKEPLSFSGIDISTKTEKILRYGLELKSADRPTDIDELLCILDAPEEDINTREETRNDDSGKSKGPTFNTESPNYVEYDIKRGGGNGFADIAGMQELKDMLAQKVIFVIKNKELAEEYRITPPNGMLLYGPPGCGKTFFAEKFAEETGFNFLFIKSSDVASSFVHGSQEKIGQLFKQAEANTPIVLCFDEFDALVPDRSSPESNNIAGEVNEFLSQMNNCSKRGIFIIATSNRPDKIDPAVLRTGRIDKLVYVPLPDYEARKELFKLNLKNRPVTDDIDYDKLARDTEGYIASDISYIVNDSAMVAAFNRVKISNELLERAIQNTQPSIRKDSIKLYDEIKIRMETTNRGISDRKRVGFV